MRSTAGECTLRDMAALTGESMESCREVARRRGWRGMYRKTALSHSGGRDRGVLARSRNMILATDEELAAMAGRVQ